MALSPMMTHYLQTKDKYKDCILFYRLGDFYEMFFEDAIKVSSLIDITLTAKDCGLKEKAPMCGVPFHAADLYISKLVALGEKVAICEQLNQPKGRELVQRDVVKVVTAGTLTNNELIDEKSNNFLASIFVDGNNIALSWADITTGEFYAREFTSSNAFGELLDVLVKVSPVEIICNSGAEAYSNMPLVTHGVLPKFSRYIDSAFNYENAKNVLLSQFKLKTLSVFGIEDNEYAIRSAGALIFYLKETQRHGLININKIVKENPDSLMMLDVNAVRNLELVKTLRDGKRYGSLLWLLDKTKTSMGARKLQSWILSPLGDVDKINYRLSGVESLYNNTLVRQSIEDTLGAVKDVGRIVGKISNGNLMPRDCVALKNSLEILPNIKFQLLALESDFIQNIIDNLGDFSDLVNLLSNAIEDEPPSNMKDGGYIKTGYNHELDELRVFGKNGKIKIAEMEEAERERTGIKNLKIAFNRVFGYYIEVTNSFKDKVPYDFQRRQTLANAERFTTDALKELEVKILSSDEQAIILESNIFNQIKGELTSKLNELLITSDSLADLDVLIALAKVAREKGYVRPNVLDYGSKLNIVDGRHPVVEELSKQRFISNDTVLDCHDNRTMILTGPNMAGKSTYMRQVALITLMAHIGSFVPAKMADIPLTDKIFTRIGASDNLISDQSTFMVEMTEVANIVNNATENSLLILDEIGRGTSTFDGLSIAWAVVEYVNNVIKAKTMFATHYHELTTLEGELEGVKNYKVTVKEIQGGIVFLRKIMRGGANRSFGIEVAELAGVGKEITERAKKILKALDKGKTVEIATNTSESVKSYSEIERIIMDVDVDNLSPMQACNVLVDLSEKIRNK